MLELDLSANPTPAEIKREREGLDREIAHPQKAILILRPLAAEDLSAFARRAELRTVGIPNREVVWIKNARIFRRGQEAQWFGGHDGECAVVLERRTDSPTAWLTSGASRDRIDQAFEAGEV